MKFTLSWLKKYLDTDASLETISEKLTSIGLEVEEVTDPSAEFAAFKAAKIVKADPHPDADRLKVCQVETEDGTVQVVCGAPNARTGMMGIFAPAGSHVPGTGLDLKKGKIRGQESNGMMVSEREMGLSDAHEGIIELDENVEIGTSFSKLYGLDDPVIEIALTPNRGDCASIYGIARDLAAAGLGTLVELAQPSFTDEVTPQLDVKIDNIEDCPAFYARTLKGVENGVSPSWLQNLLKAVGLRPISFLVDVTNYFTIAYGRPLHVYDMDKLQGDILVRKAMKDESFEALNDKSYILEGGETVITDKSGVLGLGGIVGGESTGVDENTKSVLIECAIFDPMRIARTGRDLQLMSDARYRFERGVDPAFVEQGLDLATQMICECMPSPGAVNISQMIKAGSTATEIQKVAFNPSLVEQRGGMAVDTEKQQELLSRLGFLIQEGQALIPSWRHDIEGSADLTEEILRLIGYDEIEPVSISKPADHYVPAETMLGKNSRLARSYLCANGLHETVTWSFMSDDLAEEFGGGSEELALLSPISQDLNQMRPSILPNLLQAAAQNADRGQKNIALFETGPVFKNASPAGQNWHATGLRSGKISGREWFDDCAVRNVDLFDSKADVLGVLEACGINSDSLQITTDNLPSYFHLGRSGIFVQGRTPLAVFGDIHPAILKKTGIKLACSGFEIYLENIPAPKKKGTQKPGLTIPPYQAVDRDFAFIISNDVRANDLKRAVQMADRNLITRVNIFDLFEGDNIEEGYKSLALNVTIQPVKNTLTEEDLEELSQKVIDAAASKCGATLRS